MANEKRLIDANALIEFISRNCCDGCNSYEGIKCRACEHDDEILMLEDAPTVDAVVVVHGRWRWCGSDRWNDAYQCSNCGKIAMNDSNYCPNCGAKMDGGHEYD